MIIIYNDEKKDKVVRDVKFIGEGTNNAPVSYVYVDFVDGDFLTIVGDAEQLKHFVEAVNEGSISLNLDDFEWLDYYDNMNIVEVMEAKEGD